MGERRGVKEYLLDTNSVLRYFLKDHPTQAKIILEYLLKAKKGEIHITLPLVVFVEVVYSLSKPYELKKDLVVQYLFTFLNIPYIEIEKRSIIMAALILFRDHALSITDCIIAATAHMTGKELLTFDRRLKRIKIPS